MSETSEDPKGVASEWNNEGGAGEDDPVVVVTSDGVPVDPAGDRAATEQASEEVEVDVVVVPPVPTAAKSLPPASDEPPAPMSVTSNMPPRAWPPKLIADLMTRKVITVGEHEPIGELEAWMNRFRFHHLPVVGEGMTLVGLITRADYLHAALGVGPDGKPVEKASAATLAGAIMRRNVVTAKLDAELTTACRVMLQEKLGCLPVVLEDNTLVGIVTESDFVRVALHVLEQQP
jgi:CBS domain-containing protein